MTFRAILIGLVGSLLLAGGGFINDRVLQLESVTAGHQISISVIGVLIVVMVTVNPLLFRIRRGWALRPAEAGVAVMLMMVACSIPGRGLMEHFTGVLAMPHHWYRQSPGWRKNRLMDYVPPSMLAGGREYDKKVMTGYNTGGIEATGWKASWRAVPWDKWRRPLKTWVPLIVLVAAASVCLTLVVHRQWSDHEHLRYPIAEFTTSLLQRGPGSSLGAVFRSRTFWIGLGVVLFIRGANGLYAWFPERLIQIPMGISFGAFRAKWPFLARAPGNWGLLWVGIYPIVIAFSFFLASDVSLSLGLATPLYVVVCGALVTAGVDVATDYDIGGPLGWHRAGSYVAMGLILSYLGRRYYAQTLRQALWPRPGAVEPHAVWAARFFLLSLAGIVAMMIGLGLNWLLAIALTALIMLSFVGVARISAETGLFFIQPAWQPFGVLLGLMGGYALGPEALMISGLLCAVLCIDQSMATMPYFVNGLKICDNLRVKPGRAGAGALAVYVLGLVVAIGFVLRSNYNDGLPRYFWTYHRIPTMSFRAVNTEITELKQTQELEASESLTPLERFTKIRPKKNFLWFFGAGAVLVLTVSFLRLRISWWPIHPVLFLVWSTYPLMCFSHSFLMGWALKTVVVRMGGHGLFRKCMPFMFGAIAGEILGALVFTAAGAIYYAVTGQMPRSYRFFPR